jgi:hypothetical protein
VPRGATHPRSADVPASPVRADASRKRERGHERFLQRRFRRFVVIRTELAQDGLPTELDGSYKENGPGTVVVDEAEDIDPDTTVSFTVDLTAGHYVLICNRVVGGMSHYAMGMHAGLTVD